MESKKIVVTGSGSATRKPDAIEISIKLQTVGENYQDVINKSNEKVQMIIESIGGFGINKDELKTTSYGINTNYRRKENEKGKMIQIFDGYSCYHHLTLEIDMDVNLLGKILSSIEQILLPFKIESISEDYMKKHDEVNISINFTLKDKNEIKNEAIENAIRTSREKANMIAKASDVSLGDIIYINYSFDTINVYSHTNYQRDFMKKSSNSFGSNDMECISPEDIEINDNVTITWEIK